MGDAVISGIYYIRNEVNGREYVGSTVDFDARWRKHRRELGRGVHHNQVLQRSWVKYGSHAFTFHRLIACDKHNLLYYEQKVLDTFKPAYNICTVAGSVLGMKRRPFSEQHRLKLSQARKKRPPEIRTPEQRARMSKWQKGKVRGPMSDEHKRAISESHKGRVKTKEHQAKITAALKGAVKPPVKPETRAKLSASISRVWAQRKNAQIQEAAG